MDGETETHILDPDIIDDNDNTANINEEIGIMEADPLFIDPPDRAQSEEIGKVMRPGTVIYQCSPCMKKFITRGGMENHQQKYHSSESNKDAEHNGSLNTHAATIIRSTLSAQSPLPYKCEKCLKAYKLRPELLKHMLDKHKHSNVCCGLVFIRTIHVDHHRATVHEVAQSEISSAPEEPSKTPKLTNKFNCLFCEKSFPLQCSLNTHVTKQHVKDKTFSCNACDQRFHREAGLQRHLKVEHRGADTMSFKCSFCEKSFPLQFKLNTHMNRRHTDHQKLSCSLCDRRFHTEVELQRHLKIVHRAHEKPLKCPFCSSRSTWNYQLRAHIKRVHHRPVYSSSPKGTRTYKCEVCPREFHSEVHRKLHSLVHPELKPFKCSRCQTGFQFVSNLRKHEKKHK